MKTNPSTLTVLAWLGIPVASLSVITNLAGAPNRAATTTSAFEVAFTKITNGPIAEDIDPSCSAAWGDYDNDGWLDLFVANRGTNSPDRLYRNLGGEEFVRVTNELASVSTDDSWGGQWADVDNDGDLDMFVVCFHTHSLPWPQNSTRSQMFRNDGGGVFTRVTNATTSVFAFWNDATWVDHNGDGWLDLFATTGNKWVAPSRNDFFWQNLGDGQFTAWTSSEVGMVLNPWSDTAGPAWCDFDGDGDLDLYVSRPYDRSGNFLYRNDGGQLTRVWMGSLPAEGSTYAAIWADFNNDGLFDLFTGNENGTNMLCLNRGNVEFDDVTVASGLALAGSVFSAAAGDFDNDGDLDLYVPDYYSADVLYVNRGDGTFDRADVGSVLTEGFQNGVAIWVDYNNDGFLDLFQACGDFVPAVNLLYRNDLPLYGNTNHWLKLRLKGTVSNADAIGARVWAHAIIGGKETRQVRQVTTACLSAIPMDGMRPHFGLGDATQVETLRVEWPSGHVTELTNVAVNQILTIVEPLDLKAAGLADGQFQLDLIGRRGQSYDVLTSTNLTDWVLWQTVINTSRIQHLSDPSSASLTHRFYKATQSPTNAVIGRTQQAGEVAMPGPAGPAYCLDAIDAARKRE